MNRKPDKLEYLLAKKNYRDLRPEEKEWVSQQYSTEEYDAMRTTFLESASVFKSQQTRPNPEIQSRLRQRLKLVKQPAKVTPLFAYKIPAWQAVAAFALLLFFIPQLQEKSVSDREQIFIYQTDTVFKEIPFQSIINPLVDTLSDIPKIRSILNRTNRSPVKASTAVFNKDDDFNAHLSRQVSESLANSYDTTSVGNIIARYLKDSVKNHRVAIDTGFQDMGRVY